MRDFEGFLHRHTKMEDRVGLDANHVIVDKKDWESVRMNSRTDTMDDVREVCERCIKKECYGCPAYYIELGANYSECSFVINEPSNWKPEIIQAMRLKAKEMREGKCNDCLCWSRENNNCERGAMFDSKECRIYFRKAKELREGEG